MSRNLHINRVMFHSFESGIKGVQAHARKPAGKCRRVMLCMRVMLCNNSVGSIAVLIAKEKV